MKATTTFKKYAPGLYVDSTERWIISRDVEASGSRKALYTIRECLGFGTLLDGTTLMPDYGDIVYADFCTLAESKIDVIARNDNN